MFNLWRMPAENRDEEQEIASSPMSPAIEIMARLSMSMVSYTPGEYFQRHERMIE